MIKYYTIWKINYLNPLRAQRLCNNIYITKQASGRAKIDPVIAMLNAVGLMSLNPEAMGGEYSDYSDMVMVGI